MNSEPNDFLHGSSDNSSTQPGMFDVLNLQSPDVQTQATMRPPLPAQDSMHLSQSIPIPTKTLDVLDAFTRTSSFGSGSSISPRMNSLKAFDLKEAKPITLLSSSTPTPSALSSNSLGKKQSSQSKSQRSSFGNRLMMTNLQKKSTSGATLNKPIEPRELLMSVNSLVKNRAGSVLTRQTILKSDHFERSLNEELDFYLQGAPNFRMCDFSIYGVAQPTISGISTVLAFLKCHPMSAKDSESPTCAWFNAREEPIVYINRKPFVLREEQTPFNNIKAYQGISAERLEKMEERLKDDILKEAERCGGLVLVHDESDGRVVPTWTSADHLQTTREVFDEFLAQGYRVKYFRLPISPEQAPEDRYLDDYVDIIRNTRPNDPLMYNCGVGVGRTTFAIVAATLIRRALIIQETGIDPIPVGRPPNIGLSGELWQVDDTAEMQNRAILRLVYLLEKGLSSKVQPGSAIHWALARGPLIEDLKNAVMGNYHCILQLASVMMNGSKCKKLLDEVINRCDVMINLREVILINRVAYSHTGNTQLLEMARLCLERYFFLLAFAAYIGDTYPAEGGLRFSDWFSARPEITRMLHNLRRKGARLYLFRPVEDLTVLAEGGISKAGAGQVGAGPSRSTNEMEKYVIKMRQGSVLVQHTILKVDHWLKEQRSRSTIEGAYNFRKTPGLNVYGVAQPTIQGMKNVIDQLLTSSTSGVPRTIIWINLREEPLIYINGIPYVLRDQYFTLRNITSYSGITSTRLEQIETRLKLDVISELGNYDNKILLHGESSEGEILPHWEDCIPHNVLTIKEVAKDVLKREGCAEVESPAFEYQSGKPRIEYFRVPVTAEMPPDESDFDHLVSVVTKRNVENASFVLNCQMGMGRSTTGQVIVSLVLHWLNGTRPTPPKSANPRYNYQLIHSLLRVIRNGLECKQRVDDMIDLCSQYVNLRESIEDCRIQAEQLPVIAPTEQSETRRFSGEIPGKHSDVNVTTLRDSRDSSTTVPQPFQTRKRFIKRGLLHLRRYFLLIAFQSYLDTNPPMELGLLETFSSWMSKYPEFRTMLQEFNSAEIEALVPVEQMTPGDGIALSSEVLDVVNKRNGAVLAKQTILKFDMFPGCQKLSLPDRIDGAPNYRRVTFSHIHNNFLRMVGASSPTNSSPVQSPFPPIDYTTRSTASAISTVSSNDSFRNTSSSVYGVAMPTMEGIRALLKKVQAGPGGFRKMLWTSLREEPVIYVNGRPFVLRLFQDPLKNLEATGIARERVEQMEMRMKRDIINELQTYNGRLLLHEEEADGNMFSIVPVWETVHESDVQTPGEVFESIKSEGYNVDYLRIPITDEQAPIPDVFNQLVARLNIMDERSDAIFNCQMGRGRTTTGMVVASLMEMIVGNSYIFQDIGDDYLPAIKDQESDDVQLRYQNGEYKVILQLIAVLQHGKLAKRLTDSAIDACEHLQNLRTAIFDFKLRVEALPIGSPKYEGLLEIALNYLVRYFYLITFAAYLLEEMVTDSWLPAKAEVSGPYRTETDDLDFLGNGDYQDIIVPGADTMSLDSRSVHRGSPIASRTEEDFTRVIESRMSSESTRRVPRQSFSDWLDERREIKNIVRHQNQSLD